MSDVPRIRVAGLVVVDGQVVVVRHRRANREYHLLPGGGVEYGETLGHALQREIAEETGLDCAIGRPLVVNDTIDPEGSRHVVNITFACQVRGGEVRSASEDPRVVAIELVDPAELSALDFRPPITTELLQALDDPDGYRATYAGSIFKPEDQVPR